MVAVEQPIEQKRRYLFKIIILGNSGVGKTSLMRQYVDHKFIANYKSTIGADFMTKEETINDKRITMQVWDTAGNERFLSLGVAFYRGADGLLLVYDVTDAKSFLNLNDWLEEFQIQAGILNISEFPIAVLGNKTDKEDQRQVPKKQAEEWCKEKGIKYFETSAKTNSNVNEAFSHVAELSVAFEDKQPPSYDIPPCLCKNHSVHESDEQRGCCIIQ